MISRPHKNRWYFLIQVFFYFYFAFCGNEILLSSQNRKMTELRKLLAKSCRTRADISSPVAKNQQGGEGEGAVSELSPTAVPGARQILPKPRGSGKHSGLSHQQQKGISQIFFFFFFF